MQNSKFEALNAKQIQIFKFKYSKHLHPYFSPPQGGGLRRGYFEFWSLGFRYCLEFRISVLGFNRTK